MTSQFDDYDFDDYQDYNEDDITSPLGEAGCLFPGKCCMSGEHYESECHTAEMLERSGLGVEP